MSVAISVLVADTTQKMKISIEDFLRIWSHLLKKSLIETSFSCGDIPNSCFGAEKNFTKSRQKFCRIDSQRYPKPKI